MIVLDTNILSEVMRAKPEKLVVDWLDSLPGDEFLLPSITVAEILYGIEAMPEGKRKVDYFSSVEKLFNIVFKNKVLAFDGHAAVEYAGIVARRERKEQPVSMADAMIAAICRSRNLVLATRNIKDFTDTGIELINPWKIYN
ncbi:MAG TPA: VapC toxin family PIN domain ribonuclease [Spirochaeta sp.]|nr:VapC toxin family PIN domain ribonuclease [Spirochaeta sp.]